ncbi:hypothetical protein FRX31_008850 [Thalictrum thalictroides]|uniref:Transmembrane protein n=1 Tax=Thalictrum thalictroides TaxID=46969 RepID=A0A7J6WYA5_THATH|nr:hypothetical protein FRX31_008850 [Thalictrum thalictroides]
MAGLKRFHFGVTMSMIIVFIVLVLASTSISAAARPLHHSHNFMASDHPALNIVLLPQENNQLMNSVHVDHPCHEELSVTIRDVEQQQPDEKISGKYGSIVLNLLPKGTVPPSGPSKGSNSIND